jgi:hypothetical protein
VHAKSKLRPACLLARLSKGDRYKDEPAVAPRVTVMSSRKRVDEEIEKIKRKYMRRQAGKSCVVRSSAGR